MVWWARLQERLKNFGSGNKNIQQNISQQRLLKFILENLHKILNISKNFQIFLVKFKKKLRKKLRELENFINF